MILRNDRNLRFWDRAVRDLVSKENGEGLGMAIIIDPNASVGSHIEEILIQSDVICIEVLGDHGLDSVDINAEMT